MRDAVPSKMIPVLKTMRSDDVVFILSWKMLLFASNICSWQIFCCGGIWSDFIKRIRFGLVCVHLELEANLLE